MSRSLLPLVLVASLAFTGDVEARAALRAEAFWTGLSVPRRRGETGRPVIALRTEAGGRVRIPGGTFRMGSTPEEMMGAVTLCRREIFRSRCDEISPFFRAEGHAHEVTLSSFLLDRTEVTVAAYRTCVDAGQCSPPAFMPQDPRFNAPTFPVTHVRFSDAVRYCAFTKGRLPTEAEWEFAARGTTGRAYPWGNVYNTRLSNHGAFAPDDTDASDGFSGLAPVGAFPDGATPLGILDLAGNVAEWVDETFELDDDGFGYPPKAAQNPAARRMGGLRIVRGGSHLEGAAWVRAAARGVMNLDHSASVGFRCAEDVQNRP